MLNIALVYDADYTMMDGYHPSVILKRRGIDIDEFWPKIAATQKREYEKGDKTSLDIIYLAQFMHEIRYGKLQGLTIKELEDAGKDVDEMLYPGLPSFLEDIVNDHPKCNISHNLISVGIKHILDHTSLAPYMDNIFGYTFFDDLTDNEVIDEVRSTTSSSEKVPAIIKISMGTSEGEYEFPIRNMVYLGDGQTDVPAFRFVRKRGGLAVCVYDPAKDQSRKKAESLREHVSNVLPADYSKGSPLYTAISGFIKSREPLT